MTRPATPRGMLLIDILVGIAVIGIVFTGVFGAFQLAVAAVARAKGEVEGSALLNSEMEYVRSLPYGEVGVAGGTPDGALSAVSVQSENGISYTIRTVVGYADAGHDYKAVLVTVSWQSGNGSLADSAESYVAPPD